MNWNTKKNQKAKKTAARAHQAKRKTVGLFFFLFFFRVLRLVQIISGKIRQIVISHQELWRVWYLNAFIKFGCFIFFHFNFQPNLTTNSKSSLKLPVSFDSRYHSRCFAISSSADTDKIKEESTITVSFLNFDGCFSRTMCTCWFFVHAHTTTIFIFPRTFEHRTKANKEERICKYL